VLLLRDEGVLRLDEPVQGLAPELRGLRHPAPDAPDITIRHLLSMGSGLATDDAWADRHLDLRDDELDAIVDGGLAFAALPATTFEYSNLGYGILGRAVRNATGRTVQDLVSERLLAPLGMTATTWSAPANAVAGYRARNDDAEPLVVEPALGDGVFGPMGGLFSTVRDIATWTGFLSRAFDPSAADEPAPPLSRASRREMQQVANSYGHEYSSTTHTWTTTGGGYGFGLNVLPHPKLATVVTHSGGLPGFGSNMRWVRQTGVGVVSLANATYAPMDRTNASVLDALGEAGAVTMPRTNASDSTVDAAARLVALLSDWGDTAARELFADNVDQDEPFTARAAAAARLVEEHGPLRLARVITDAATSATAVVHAREVELHVSFELTPFTPGRIQKYEVTVER
jgi:CubicO group peptidase (beta-lactamase class C family)